MKKKLTNISESKLTNSTEEVKCPECSGNDSDCKFCKGAGVVTVSKSRRHKQWQKDL